MPPVARAFSSLPTRGKIELSVGDRLERLRKAVYRAFIVGYLAYAEENGFKAAHIWSCPPKKDMDYIFYCHPKDQTYLAPVWLLKW